LNAPELNFKKEPVRRNTADRTGGKDRVRGIISDYPAAECKGCVCSPTGVCCSAAKSPFLKRKGFVFSVAIDGPVASGKGTVARRLSEHLGISCLDTGAIYRGVAVFMHRYGLSLEELAEKVSAGINLQVKIIDNITRVWLDGDDITDKIRDNHISALASKVAVVKEVRAFCTQISRTIARSQSIIVEGRDICRVVLPDADFKFLLTADVKVRAERRYKDLAKNSENITFEQVFKETCLRDKSDREKGGFKEINDAILIDATNMTVDEAVRNMLQYIPDEFKLL
jgi:cytidylate kinase